MSEAADLLIHREQLERRAHELGAEISASLGKGSLPPVFVGVLKGSTFFLADLVRALSIDVVIDFISISSYGGSPGVVRIVKDLDQDIVGRDVVIVEDIVDTGLTLTYLRRSLLDRAPSTLRTVTLLDRVARRIVPVPVEHVGFEIPDAFVIGYGLDFQGRYRNLPDLFVVPDAPKLAEDRDLLVPPLFGP